MAAEDGKTFGVFGIGSQDRGDKSGPSGFFANIRKRFRHSESYADTPGNQEAEDSLLATDKKEAPLDNRHVIADVFPNSLDDKNPIEYPDIEKVMEWAKHPEVAGHIYQLESGPQELYKGDRRSWTYLEYYRGLMDDEGRNTDPRNCDFFKAVNSKGEMIAITTMRWKDVEFVKRGRTAYWERLIVDPELQGKKVGLALAIDVLDTAFYRYDGYDGRPATEVRGSTYVDRLAGRFDRNDLFLRILGFQTHGNTIIIENRFIQPWKLSLASYEEARPAAIERLREQPGRREYLKKIGPKLQQQQKN